jgi:MFS family permease
MVEGEGRGEHFGRSSPAPSSATVSLTEPAILEPTSEPNLAAIQRRTLTLLFISQIAGGVGVAVGISVAALLAAEMVGVGVSGLAQSAAVTGAALLAIPATRIVRRSGRRPSLTGAYLVAAVGGVLTVTAAITQSTPLLFLGFFLFGGGTTASLQARYAAVDLAPTSLYGRHLSIIVWATTVGGVVGPNLAAVAGNSLSGYGIPTLAAPFVFSTVLFLLCAVVLLTFLRSDPLLVAADVGVRNVPRGTAAPVPHAGMGAALRAVLAHDDARLGIVSVAAGHVVMVGVMAMTPVHILGGGHGAAGTLKIVGIVLSIHVAGMYAFSPITGWLSDRFGRRPVIVGGIMLLLAACAVAGTAGHDSARLALGLMLLGLGWSGTMVAGSALLSESMSPELRPSAQGLSDLVMGLSAATAGALSGVVVEMRGYPTLTLLAALMTAPPAALIASERLRRFKAARITS